VQKVREAANRAQCSNNLKQIALAAHNYHDTYQRFPTGWHQPAIVDGRPTGGTNLWIGLLPYFEQDNLYRRWDNYDNRNNVAGGMNAVQAQVIKLLICPSDPLQPVVYFNAAIAPPWTWGYYGISSYGGNGGTRSFSLNYSRIPQDGIFFRDSSVCLLGVTDGSSNTFLFGERYHRDPQFDLQQPLVSPNTGPFAQMGRWACVAGWGTLVMVELSTPVPINYQVPPGGDSSTLTDRGCAFGSGHPGGANFAFADGSVRFVSDSIPLATLQALSTRAGGEVVSGSDF
jgi:prepilin-type processing-associated H-X9-DG protein